MLSGPSLARIELSMVEDVRNGREDDDGEEK